MLNLQQRLLRLQGRQLLQALHLRRYQQVPVLQQIQPSTRLQGRLRQPVQQLHEHLCPRLQEQRLEARRLGHLLLRQHQVLEPVERLPQRQLWRLSREPLLQLELWMVLDGVCLRN